MMNYMLFSTDILSFSKGNDFQEAAVWLWNCEREHGFCNISNTLL